MTKLHQEDGSVKILSEDEAQAFIPKERITTDEQPDWFEKAFGKEPEVGYEFRHLTWTFGWRAIVFQWSCSGVGFGELAIQFKGEEGFDIDNECMDDEFTVALLTEAIKRIDAGQKTKRWVDGNFFRRAWEWITFKFGGYYEARHCIDDTNGHEQFIKNVCLTFLSYLQKGMVVKKAMGNK